MGRLNKKTSNKRKFKSKTISTRKALQKINEKVFSEHSEDDYFKRVSKQESSSWGSGWNTEETENNKNKTETVEEIRKLPLDLPSPSKLPPLPDPKNFTNNLKSLAMEDSAVTVKDNNNETTSKSQVKKRTLKSPFPTDWGTLDDSIWNLRRKYRRRRTRRGYKVVNGQLLSVNDVGVLLREAAERVARRKKLFYATNKPAMTTKLERRRRLMALARKRRRNIMMMMNPSPFDESLEFNTNPNRLIIDTKSKAQNKLLAFYNLTIGVNAKNLKKIIEKLGSTKIVELKIKDLLSGSAIGYIVLENTTLQEMQRIRDMFNGALVDGRTVKVDIISTSMAALAY